MKGRDDELNALVGQYLALRVLDRARARAWVLASLQLVDEEPGTAIVCRERRRVADNLGGRVVRGIFGRATTTADGRA